MKFLTSSNFEGEIQKRLTAVAGAAEESKGGLGGGLKPSSAARGREKRKGAMLLGLTRGRSTEAEAKADG